MIDPGKSLILCACILLNSVGLSAIDVSPSRENHHVYLLIGQSNMAGRAELTPDHSGTLERCYLLNSEDQWEISSHPLNKYSSIRKKIEMQRLNPGYGFAIAMLSGDREITLGLVVNARGGTKIEEWEKGTEYYAEAVRRSRIAARSGSLKGILWHQGEGNSRNAEEYLEKLTRLIKNLRSDLGAPDLPFVAGQVFYNAATKPHTFDINTEIAKLPETVRHTGCVLSSGLTTFDNTHFDSTSTLEMGKRYAREMQRIQRQHLGFDKARNSGKSSNMDSTDAKEPQYASDMNNKTLLRALELDKQGDWEGAHRLAQDVHSADGSWVHAYLHRKEGDLGNAAYWYSRAGKPVPEDSLEEEWGRLKEAFSGE